MGALARAYEAIVKAHERVNMVHNRIRYAYRKEMPIAEKGVEEMLEAHSYLRVASDVFRAGGWIYDRLLDASEKVYGIWVDLAASRRKGYPPPYGLQEQTRGVMRTLMELENALFPEFKEQVIREAWERRRR